jgi:apolipoprotein N-acyltransferase
MDKMANGVLLYWMVASFSTNGHALRWIISVVPIAAAIGTTFFTWLGLRMYSDKLAKMSVGSVITKKSKSMPAARKGSVA